MAKGILIAAMDFSACPEDEFHDWYDLEHVPERLRVPGFLNAERWIDTGNPKYVALYHLTSPYVVDTPEWKQASASTPMPAQVRDRISNRLRLVCRPYARA